MRTYRAPTDRSPGRHRHAMLWLGMVTLLLSLFSPALTFAAAAAQEGGVPPFCEPGYVEQNGECVPEDQVDGGDIDAGPDQECAEGEIYDPNAQSCVPDPSYQPPQDNPVTVEVTKWECPPEAFDQQGNPIDTSGCVYPQQPYQMWHVDPNGMQTNLPGSGDFTANNLPAGTHAIWENVPPGYVAYVWCQVYDPNQGGANPQLTTLQGGESGQQGQVQYDVQPGWVLDCDWYNVPTEQYGTVIIHKYRCDENWDIDFNMLPGDPQQQFGLFQQYCSTPHGGVNFDYEQNGQSVSPPGQLTTGQDGMASWDQAPTGDFVLREQLPDSYAFSVVFCSTHEAAAANNVYQPTGMLDQTSFGGTLQPGWVYDCYWFNFPNDQLQIIKYWCDPAWTPTEGAGIDQYQMNCTGQPPVQETWVVSQSGQEITTLQTGGPGPGYYAGYHQLPQDQPISILEQLPDGSGYGAPVVFCDEYQRGNPGQPTGSYQYDPASGVGWTPRDGYYLVCFVYNVYEQGGDNTVTVYKWDCAPGTESGREQQYYEGGLPEQDTGPCETEHGGLPIFLYDGHPDSPREKTTNHNEATWDAVTPDPQGNLRIAVTEPGGYGEPMVWCGVVGDDAPWTQYPATGGEITITPQGTDWDYQCNWYNIPAEAPYGQVVIEKYWCPPVLNFVTTPTRADLQGACQEQPSGTPNFTLDGPTAAPQTWPEQQAQGGPPASVFWGDLPAGEYVVTETGLDDTWSAMIYCHVSTGEAGGVTDLPSTTGTSYTHQLEAGTTLDCAWFNQQVEGGDYAVIQIEKYWCAEGYAPAEDAPQSDVMGSGQCIAEDTQTTTLSLEGPGGPYDPKTVPANGSNVAQWPLAQGGTYTVTEQLPPGYRMLVYCHVAPLTPNGAVDDPQRWEVMNGNQIQWEAQEGYYWICAIFNLYDGEDGNQVTVYKWLCEPGTMYGQEMAYYQGENGDPGPCESEHGGLPIFLYDGHPDSPRERTTNHNEATWNEVTADGNGNIRIAVTEPPDYGDPMVWCGLVGDDASWAPYTATGGEITITPQGAEWDYQCNWYNLPGDVGGFGEEGTNWITIYKYYCAPGTQGSDQLGAMQDACQNYHNGVNFTLSGGELANPSQKATAGGKVEWGDLYAGAYTVTESVPPGYGESLVWCGYIARDGQEIEAAQQQYAPYALSDTGGVQLDVEGQYARIVCYWFDFPGEESTVTLYKYDCTYQPQGFQSLDLWQEACWQPGDGHTFTLQSGQNPGEEMTTDASGMATWTGVPEGGFTLWETMQPGWGEPVVWCSWTAYLQQNGNVAVLDSFPQQYTTTGGVYEGEISYPGTTYVCYWFNIPIDYSSITIYKYLCPEGYLEGVTDDPLGAYQGMCTLPGNDITFTLENSTGSSNAKTLNGKAVWSDVPLGQFTLTEQVPNGYDPPLWFCGPAGNIVPVEGATNAYTGTIDSHPTDWVCYVFNFPDPDRTIIVYKYLCPEGYQGTTYDEWYANCTMPQSGVSFTVTDGSGNWTQPTGATGMATWYGVAQGEVTLDEHIPPGYFEPVIYCRLEAVNGAAFAEDWTSYPSTNGAITRSLDYSEYTWECHIFNIPKGPGEITIYKWLCPPGYDFYGWGADPSVDCTTAMNGVTFTLDQPVGNNLQTDTGDSVPGAVYFGGLDPGDYVVTETVPPDIDWTFVLECTGSDDDKVHPYPLMWGSTLPIKVAGGDSITCHWYNVPYPENGWVTVYKYQCWTSTFKSAVDCEIYEYGATFELFGWPGNASLGTGTTNAGGLYTWNNVPEGAYTIDEVSHKACKITSTKTDGQGHAWVDTGQGTIIKVYNCKPKTPTTPTPNVTPPPKTPGKVPGKYPNTGVDPSAAEGLAPSRLLAQGTPTPPVNEAPEDEYYRISCLEGTPAATSTAEATAPATPTETATQEEFDLPIEEEDASTPTTDGTPAPEEDCARGALPERVVIDAAQVDAGVETLEIVDGIMEQPTGPELVTWYKETGRLGENNNVVIAGHLNYWNVPEGVFFYLDQLQPGDRVEITGDDGQVYVYQVEWVRQESNLEPPAADVIGPTDTPSLTLITCGGEWNASISEYDERTVARAVQVEVRPAEAADTALASGPLAA